MATSPTALTDDTNTTAPPSATPTATPDSSPPMMNQPSTSELQPPPPGGSLQATFLPKTQHTLLNTMKGIALGMLQGGIPGAIVGGIDPQAPVRQRQYAGAMAQAKLQETQARVRFENAQAAHMVANATMEDKKLQNFDEDHRLQVTKSNIEVMKSLQELGVSPIATTTMDGSPVENSKSAMTNLENVTASHGAVPPTLTLHVGAQSVSYDLNQLAPAKGTLDQINKVRQITGQPPIDAQSWAQQARTPQGIALANDSWKFFAPMPSEGNLTAYKNYLGNLQNQSASADRDANLSRIQSIVSTMQKTLDQQNERQGKLKGAEAQAAQPGQTAAQVATIKATSGPEAAAAGAKAEAVAKGTAGGQLAGGGAWKPKVTADEKKKTELAENIAENATAVNAALARRPDLVGAVAGRFTNIQQMIGNNDPDIAAIGNRIHNIAMANSGVHGFRSQEGVQETETNILNGFKNGPTAVAGALASNVDSVQTFIDNARPETYQTHSKMGGAGAYYKKAMGAAQPIYASAPGKPRLMSNDGGKTWQTAPAQQ